MKKARWQNHSHLMHFVHLRARDTRKMVSFCTCIEPGQGRDLPSCPLCPMVPWKDMSDPGKAWQDKKVFPDVVPWALQDVVKH